MIDDEEEMNISKWLDMKAAEVGDVSQIELPDEFYDEEADETIFFQEINPCGLFCRENHPFSMVDRYGHWYLSRGQDKKAGIHATGFEWRFITKDKEAAMKAAKSHIE